MEMLSKIAASSIHICILRDKEINKLSDMLSDSTVEFSDLFKNFTSGVLMFSAWKSC
jgi:hypothetical protein